MQRCVAVCHLQLSAGSHLKSIRFSKDIKKPETVQLSGVLGISLQAANAKPRQWHADGFLTEITGLARFKLYRLSAQVAPSRHPDEVTLKTASKPTAVPDHASPAIADVDAALADIDRWLDGLQ